MIAKQSETNTSSSGRGNCLGSTLLCFGLVLLAIGCGSARTKSEIPLRIGHQKWGTVSILKARKRLESVFATHGCRVEWVEFPSGPPLLEAMKAGSIDFGNTGDSPPVFAQAAGVPLVYVGASSPCPEDSAILVRADSPIRELRDLKGKKVAFTRGSSAHTMVVRALGSVELTLNDIEPIYLTMADARAAFETGGVDAWSTWDPYLAKSELEGGVRVIASGLGLVPAREFYFTSSDFLKRHRDLVSVLIRELNETKNWANDNPLESAKILAREIGMDVKVLERAEKRSGRHGIETDQSAVAREQQQLADNYLQLGLLPGPIDVQSVVDFVLPPKE